MRSARRGVGAISVATGVTTNPIGKTGSARLVRFPIESVDFLDAGVAGQQRRFIGGQAAPVSERSSGGLKPLQAYDAFQFVICDLHAVVALLIVEDTVEIHIAAIA